MSTRLSTIAEANTFLAKTYLANMNRKFARPPADSLDAHVPLGDVSLKDIFCFEYERVVGNDYVIRFEKRLFQILKSDKGLLPRPKDKVTIRIRLDGDLAVIWKGTKLLVKELTNTKGQNNQDAA